MRQIISYLKKFRENNLSEFVDVPKALPKCYVCDEHTHPYTRYNGVGVCEDCYSALETCIYCDNRSLNIKNGICTNCLEDSASVQSYSHKPEPLFHRVGRHERPYLTHESYSKGNPVLHYGIEIEMDLERSQQDYPDIQAESNKFASFVNLIGKGITGRENLLYCKSDCTCLVEVVSHPFSWNYWNKFGREMFQTLFSKLRENKLHGYNAPNSGMHIHVSRDALKPYDILKIMSFVNNPENFQFILDISQRNRERLEEWANPYLNDDAWNKLPRICQSVSMAMDYTERSSAVNLHNRPTIEFRIFRGTLNTMCFSKNLEFVKSLIQWVKVTGLNTVKGKQGLESYLSFVAKNYNDYENLCFFLSRRNYRKFSVVVNRWTRKHLTNLNKLSFSTDGGEL
jgi:hypothetical protein